MKVKVSRKLDNLDSLIKELKKSSDEVGAVAVFVGVVRGTREAEKVLRLEYEAHETLTLKAMEKIVEDLKTKHGIIDAVAEHRIGTVQAGEDVMYVLVASKHREEGFKALAEMVDRIKHETPIWKKEVTEETAYWVENL
ncbi:MAG: molybdenum cofactor biosynthesis protein MoaE [Candidatus Bathyarchaeota archaeon]|nr:molybdenum cofactor biosynthesis protein MoaE [Candidatus Bathyarchaeota archaeon]